MEWCLDVTRRRHSNFYYSFFTLPKPLYRDMCVLYAFMRVSDDLGDDQQVPPIQRAELLAEWQTKLAAALDARRYDIPYCRPLVDDFAARRSARYLCDVVDGVAMDLHPKGFDTFEELSTYCYHVAGAVGLCCIHIWGFSDPQAIPLAIECGLAFQLTNILRDVAEDARAGRCYLPREDLRRFQLTTEDLGAPTSTETSGQTDGLGSQPSAQTICERATIVGLRRSPRQTNLRRHAGDLRRPARQVDRRGPAVQRRRLKIGTFRKLRIAVWSLLRYRWLAAR